MTVSIAYYGSRPTPSSKEEAVSLLHELTSQAKIVAIDVETINLRYRIAIGLSIATSPQDAFYFSCFPDNSPYIPLDILANPDITKVFHNCLFDIPALKYFIVDTTNITDTAVIARLLNLPGRLTELSRQILGLEAPSIADRLKPSETMLDLADDIVAKGCCIHAQATLALYYAMIDKVDKEYLKVEMDLIPILLKMSKRGIKIDQQLRAKIEEELKAGVAFYTSLASGLGFNPASPKQSAFILAKRGTFLPFTWSKKSLSTSESILNKLDDPLAGLILNFRHSNKLLGTYIKPMADEERAYCRFHTDAITGRITSAERNMQNIPPGRTRNIFLPDSGCFTDLDFSQIELRILAYLSQDRVMQHIFDTNGDIHQETANFMQIDRRIAKNVNFALIYGATPETIMETAGITNLSKAKQLLALWFEQYREAGLWIARQQQDALRNRYIKTMYNRVIRLPLPDEEDDGAVARKAINYPIQASAAEIVKRAMIKCKDLPLVLQIHDELLIDGKVELPVGLDSIAPLRTPYSVKYLERWE